LERLDKYNVGLRNMVQDTCRYEYVLDDDFFKCIDAPDIRKGHLQVCVTVKKAMGVFVLDFRIEGVVVVPCDRCLDDMEIAVDTTNSLKVKLGIAYADEDEFVVVPEVEGYVNIAWFVYEFVVLSLPMQHMHESGKCNERMMAALNQHLCIENEYDDAAQSEEEELNDIDPRWNELRKITDNN
jgi:uncharacterized metal-binding protein YceD (DUF177 family)